MKKYISLLLIMICSVSIVHAANPIESSVYSIFVHGLSSGGGIDAGSTVPNGATKNRTGYLCYIVTKDGKEIKGTHPVFIKSDNYDGSLKPKDIIKPRNGLYSNVDVERVSDFRLPRPWDVDSGNTIQNKGNKILSIFNDISFLETFAKKIGLNKGDEEYKKIVDGKAYIVVEIVMNFQFSKPSKDPANIPQSVKNAARNQASKLSETAIGYARLQSNPVIKSTDHLNAGTVSKSWDFLIMKHWGDRWSALHYELTNAIYEACEQKAIEELGVKSYELQGEPVEGTVVNLIDYRNSHGYNASVLGRYTNLIAPWSLHIDEDIAGFEVIKGKDEVKLSDGEVKTYGMGMFVVNANLPNDPEPVTPPGMPETPWAKDPHGVLLVDNIN